MRETSVMARGRAREPRENDRHAVLLAAHGGEREGTGDEEHSGETGKTLIGERDKTAGPTGLVRQRLPLKPFSVFSSFTDGHLAPSDTLAMPSGFRDSGETFFGRMVVAASD